MKPPAEADIVAMEAQSFGVPPSYGGPFAGVIATRDKFVRQMPGRLAGQTTDTRRQARLRADAGHARATHSPREGDLEHLHQPGAVRAGGDRSSHACSAKKACAKWPHQNLAKAQFALAELEKIPGVRRAFDGAVLQRIRCSNFRARSRMVNAELLRRKNHRPACRWALLIRN